jgi:FKBP-type peptidyl-prolyl cis-trans isomerase
MAYFFSKPPTNTGPGASRDQVPLEKTGPFNQFARFLAQISEIVYINNILVIYSRQQQEEQSRAANMSRTTHKSGPGSRGIFARYWRKAILKTRHFVSAPRTRILERALLAARKEKKALREEVSGIEAELDTLRSSGREQLREFEQRLGQIESEREATHSQLETLQSSLTEAITRLENSETKVGLLTSKLEQERRKHQSEMRAAADRARSQERRLNWVLVVAAFAFLLGTVASVTKIWDTRNNARVLAELSRDIKSIKASMELQLGSMRESLEEYRLPPAAVPDRVQSPDPDAELAGKPGESQDRQRAESATALSTFSYHPQRKYRTRTEMEDFFEENAREMGVVTLASGLQYKVLSNGIGRSPAPGDWVVFDYRAYLPDGTEIYNSYNESQPVAFSIDTVVPGVREALLRMEEGAQWELYIPPALAYREDTRNRKRYGYEPLIYIVELRSVVAEEQSIGNQY